MVDVIGTAVKGRYTVEEMFGAEEDSTARVGKHAMCFPRRRVDTATGLDRLSCGVAIKVSYLYSLEYLILT